MYSVTFHLALPLTLAVVWAKTSAMRLSELPKNAKAIITQINIDASDVKSRLSDFGLQVGNPISCVNYSPIGGPRAYRLSHGVFAIDKDVSDSVEIKMESK